MATAILESDVLAFSPELSVVNSDAWVDIVAYVNEMDLTLLGETAQVDRMAKIFLAAHIGTMDARASNGSAGPVTSVSAGGIRRSFGLVATASGTALGSTRYGQMYLDIISASSANGPMVV